ncbi:MAG: diadenylate cyclase CdaA [Lentisphaerota bacterium]
MIEQWHVPGLSGLVEILVLALAYYYLIQFFRGTRGAQVLLGFSLVLVILLVMTYVFRLDALNWVLQRFSVYLAVAFLIIFQPEIRRALAELGKQHVFSAAARERSLVDHIIQAVLMLAERKIGALIAIEREIGTRAVQETGVKIDGAITPEMLATIFFPHTPLHDGGVIIARDRISAAGCLFPLSQREELSKSLGTRHRAAIGMTEETDAVVIVVSEETGAISVSYKGRLIRGLDPERLRRMLSVMLLRATKAKSRWSRFQENLDLTPEGVAKTADLMEKEFETNSE